MDAVQLEAAMSALGGQFPPIRVEDVDLGNNRLRKFQSDPELFKEYQYLFASINWDNLERGLTFIADKMKGDNKALIKESNEVDEEGYRQAGCDAGLVESSATALQFVCRIGSSVCRCEESLPSSASGEHRRRQSRLIGMPMSLCMRMP